MWLGKALNIYYLSLTKKEVCQLLIKYWTGDRVDNTLGSFATKET